jgi:ADP-heptose:LPS heptosyltransferase
VLAEVRELAPVDPRLTHLETSRVELRARVAAHARILVCGDTGPAHHATAFATPSVLLFGPTEGDPHGAEVDPGCSPALA